MLSWTVWVGGQRWPRPGHGPHNGVCSTATAAHGDNQVLPCSHAPLAPKHASRPPPVAPTTGAGIAGTGARQGRSPPNREDPTLQGGSGGAPMTGTGAFSASASPGCAKPLVAIRARPHLFGKHACRRDTRSPRQEAPCRDTSAPRLVSYDWLGERLAAIREAGPVPHASSRYAKPAPCPTPRRRASRGGLTLAAQPDVSLTSACGRTG
jgi:hypothetical protein